MPTVYSPFIPCFLLPTDPHNPRLTLYRLPSLTSTDAYFQPHLYLALSHSPPSSPLSSLTAPTAVPLATRLALAQLANLYLLFALNEGLVLRCTRNRAVWRTLLFGLLLADLGHLWTGTLLVGGGAQVSGGEIAEKVKMGVEEAAVSWAEWMMRPASGGSGGWDWGYVYWRIWEWNSMGWGNVGFGEFVLSSLSLGFLFLLFLSRRRRDLAMKYMLVCDT